MFKTSLLMLAAVASVGATLALSTASADARPGFGGHGGGFHGGGFRGGFARVAPHRPHFHPRFPHRPHFVRWHRPWIYGVGAAAVAAPAYAAVAPKPAAAGPCTCLSKEYTPDNLVVFKDRCTKEMAAAPIGGPQQQGQAQPEPQPQPEAGETEPMTK
jgi:hypothetical protein